MNDTLSRIKAEAERTRVGCESSRDLSLETAQRLHEAARPLLDAFTDVRNHFVKVEVLKRIWPSDFDRRPDRAQGLVIAMLGGAAHPSGLMLQVPGGIRAFEVQETWDGRLVYVSSRETGGMRPQSWRFETPEPWLAGFYQTMAMLLEI